MGRGPWSDAGGWTRTPRAVGLGRGCAEEERAAQAQIGGGAGGHDEAPGPADGIEVVREVLVGVGAEYELRRRQIEGMRVFTKHRAVVARLRVGRANKRVDVRLGLAA